MALDIITTFPEDGENLIETDTIIRVEFDDDIDSKSLNTKTFIVYEDNTPIKGEVSYLARDKQALFKPFNKLKPDTEYRIVLSTDIMSITGDKLNSTYTFNFTTQEDNYQLNKPRIIHPSDGATVNEPLMKWQENDKAENYSIEISDRPDFSNLVYTSVVFQETELNAPLDSGREYFFRVKAQDIYNNDPEGERIYFNSDELEYYGSNHFQAQLDLEYCPLHRIESVYVEGKGNLKILDGGKNKEGEVYIKSSSNGIIGFNYPLPTNRDIYIDLEYLPSYKDSQWSDTVSFYYDKTEIDFEEFLNSLNEERAFIEISDKFEVTPDRDFIYFKLYYGYLDVDDLEVKIEGNSVNDSPYYERDGEIAQNLQTGFSLTYSDLDQMAEDRFEYKFGEDYTPLDSLSQVTVNGEDVTESCYIVDATSGLVAIEKTITEGDSIDISLEYSALQVVEQTEVYTLMRHVV